MNNDTQMTLLEIPKYKNPTSGCKGAIAQIAIQELQKSRDPKKALAAVLEQHPTAKTSMKCIYWYASKMKIDLQNRPKVETPKVETFEEILKKVSESGVLKTAETVTKNVTPRLVKKNKVA